MKYPDSILCEHCGADSPVSMHYGFTKYGEPTERPIYITHDGQMYVLIECPACGEREQCIKLPQYEK